MNLVMTSITNYTWYDVEPWYNSLRQTGYDGSVAIVCFDVSASTIKEFKNRGIISILTGQDDIGNSKYAKPQPWNICVERFLVYAGFLEKNPQYKRVILTDAKDVIFQRDPFEDIKSCYVGLSSEGLTYENEPWGKNNLQSSFGPFLYDKLASKYIVNAGVIGGDSYYIKDLCLNIYLVCHGLPSHILGGGGPDQAALNILTSMSPWMNASVVAPYWWACQAGTQADPNKIAQYRPHLMCKEPVLDGDLVKLPTGETYAIVHQYDRVPEWNTIMNKKYREVS